MIFTPINGEEISRSFYSGIKEPEIEKLYYQYFRQVNSCITCNKEKLGIGTTDGIIRFYNEEDKLLFWALQETKRDVGLDSVWFGRSILQAIMYLGNVFYDTNILGVDNFKGVFLDSARYFCFVSKEDLIPIMEKFEPLWNKYYRVKPSAAYHIPELEDFIPVLLSELKISMFSLNIKFRLDQLIRDLYENNI